MRNLKKIVETTKRFYEKYGKKGFKEHEFIEYVPEKKQFVVVKMNGKTKTVSIHRLYNDYTLGIIFVEEQKNNENFYINGLPFNFGDLIYLVDHESERVYAEEVCRIGHDRQGNIFYNDNRAEECFKTEAEAWERLRNG